MRTNRFMLLVVGFALILIFNQILNITQYKLTKKNDFQEYKIS